MPACFAQFGKGIALEPSVHIGRIIKHTSNITIGPYSNSYGIHLQVKFQTYGKKNWHRPNRYPYLGVNFLFHTLGNQEQLGQAFGILPNISIRLLDRQRTDIRFMVGTGVAVLSEHFDPIDNPENNAIGSTFNNVTGFRIGIEHQLQQKWKLNTGISFTHFSNGSVQLPNFGLNIPAFYLGMSYTPRPVQPSEFNQLQESWQPEPVQRRLGLSLHFGLAFREMLTFGGPRNPIYIASIAGFYQLSPHNRLLLGVDYEFNRGVYKFGFDTFSFNNEKEARQGARRIMLFAADEILMGNLSILLQSGIYISKKSFLKPGFWYNKLGARYYLPAFGRPKTRFYLGVYLKAHVITAEYISFGIGAAI